MRPPGELASSARAEFLGGAQADGCVLRHGGCRELRTRADGRLGGVGAMLGQMHRPRKRPSSWHAPVIVVSVVSVLAAGAGLAGCGGASARSAGTSPARAGSTPARTAQRRPAPIEVVVSVFPLAQLTSYVGGTAVHVVDLAPPGTQPQDLSLSAAEREEIKHAAVVIDVGDGYQPEVESAAGSARRHLSVLPAVSKQGNPYEFWLNPYLMADARGRDRRGPHRR